MKAQIDSLNEQIASAQQEVERLNRVDVEIARQSRDIDIAANKYLNQVAKLEQARIDEALENAQYSNLSVLQPPSYSKTPTSPDMMINVGLAILLATAFSLGIVLLSERQVVVEVPPPAAVESATADAQAYEHAPKRRAVVQPGNPR
jgi:uncharacterized protein involved in exopolysaccharide biosynthesis